MLVVSKKSHMLVDSIILSDLSFKNFAFTEQDVFSIFSKYKKKYDKNNENLNLAMLKLKLTDLESLDLKELLLIVDMIRQFYHD